MRPATDHWFFQLLFPTHDALSQAYKQCQQNGFTVDVIRIYQPEESDSGTSLLTEKQEATVTKAFEQGFYDIPRETSLTELAESVGQSHQSLSEQLRRAHRNLIAAHVIGGGEGDHHDYEE